MTISDKNRSSEKIFKSQNATFTQNANINLLALFIISKNSCHQEVWFSVDACSRIIVFTDVITRSNLTPATFYGLAADRQEYCFTKDFFFFF